MLLWVLHVDGNGRKEILLYRVSSVQVEKKKKKKRSHHLSLYTSFGQKEANDPIARTYLFSRRYDLNIYKYYDCLISGKMTMYSYAEYDYEWRLHF